MPKPERYRTILASYTSLHAAGDAVAQVVAAGLLPGAMEIMDRLAIEAAEASVGAGYPQDAAALLIVEVEGEALQVEEEFAQVRQVIEASGATEVRVAHDDAERARRSGRGARARFPRWVGSARTMSCRTASCRAASWARRWPGIERLSDQYKLRVANVFHAGDGNLHPLILYNGREAGALERAEALAGEILHMCIELGGSITGEHGVGMEKRQYMPDMFSETDMGMMHALRRAIDPQQIANRGKMLPVAAAAAGDAARNNRHQPWKRAVHV